MELFVIIVVLGLGYFAYRNYTKDVTIEKDERVVAPYKMEPPTLDPVVETHEKEINWPFPNFPKADKPTAEQKPVGAITPAKKSTAAKPKATPAKSTAAKKAPAKKTAKPKATPAKKTTAAKPKK